MTVIFSPWMYSEHYTGVAGGLYYFGSSFTQGLSPNSYATALTIGGWYSGNGRYEAGRANSLFAPRATAQQQSGGYPPALEDRARDYVRKALSKQWMPDNKRYATGYDAYTTNQHAEISRSEQAGNAEGREKTVWDLADSLKDWVENGDKRADYSAASDAIRRSSGSYSEKLAAQVANLIVPGSTEVTEEVARTALGHLKAAEMPTDKSPNAIMAAYIRKLGGETVAQSLVDEVSAQVASRGVPTKGRNEYIADLEKKKFKAPDAAAVYDELLASKTDSERHEAMSKMGEVKTDKVDAAEKAKQYDQNARVEAMRALGMKNEEELRAALEKYKAKNFSAFLEAIRRDVAAGRIPAAPRRRAP